MQTLLRVIGGLSIAGGVVIGLMAGSAPVIIGGVAGGFIAGAVYFALATVLDNQEAMAYAVKQLSMSAANPGAGRFVGNAAQKKCAKCERDVDVDYKSCPHCAHRIFAQA